MFEDLVRTLVKVAAASLFVGAVLAHFGITVDLLMSKAGVSPEQLQEYVRQAVAWAVPNMTLGAIIIIPIWFVAFILRPPRRSSE